MPAHRLGQFYEAFASWRRALGRAAPEAAPVVFSNAVAEIAGYVRAGLDVAVAADELTDMAASIGFEDTDRVQAVIAETFARINSQDDHESGIDWDNIESAVQLDREPELPPQKPNGRAGRQTAISLLRSSGFLDAMRPPEYLIESLLQRRFLYALTGKTGSGKTAIALYIAACVALGRPIGDMEVTQGQVLYLAGENPDDVRYRWLAMSQQMDFDWATIPVVFSPERAKLSESWGSLIDQTRALGNFALVVVDTSAAYFEGDEVNSNTQQGNHARMLRGLIGLPGGPTVIVNCHPVKNAAADNLLPLGAGAFLNEVDANLTCAVEGSAVELHWQGKIRGPDFAPVAFELRTVTHERLKDTAGRLIPTVVAKHLSDAALEGMQQAALGDAALVLAEIKKDGRASQADYAARLGWAFRTGKPARSRVQRAIDKLRDAKLIAVELGAFVVTPKGERYLDH